MRRLLTACCFLALGLLLGTAGSDLAARVAAHAQAMAASQRAMDMARARCPASPAEAAGCQPKAAAAG